MEKCKRDDHLFFSRLEGIMLTDFEEDFANSFSSDPNPGNSDTGYNGFFDLQSPLSVPSVDETFNDSSNGTLALGDYSTFSQPGSSSFATSVSPNNRVADFSSYQYDYSYNFLACNPQSQNNCFSKQTSAGVPMPNIRNLCSQPSLSTTVSEPQFGLTLNDIYSNFAIMQQQQAASIQANQAKIPIKKKIHNLGKKQVFKPFASIESCEISVDRMRSFFETHKRKTKVHLF